MALVECYECGAHISDKALTCPKCGAPISQTETEYEDEYEYEDESPSGNKLVGIVCLLFGLGLLLIGFIFMDSNSVEIVGGTYDFKNNCQDWSNAYCMMNTTYVFSSIGCSIAGLVFLWFAKKNLFPNLRNILLIIVLVVDICCLVLAYNAKRDSEEAMAKSWREMSKQTKEEKRQRDQKQIIERARDYGQAIHSDRGIKAW